jgi:hypothetical protein
MVKSIEEFDENLRPIIMETIDYLFDKEFVRVQNYEAVAPNRKYLQEQMENVGFITYTMRDDAKPWSQNELSLPLIEMFFHPETSDKEQLQDYNKIKFFCAELIKKKYEARQNEIPVDFTWLEENSPEILTRINELISSATVEKEMNAIQALNTLKNFIERKGDISEKISAIKNFLYNPDIYQFFNGVKPDELFNGDVSLALTTDEFLSQESSERAEITTRLRDEYFEEIKIQITKMFIEYLA